MWYTEVMLQAYNLKSTPIRLAILNVFSKGCNPICAEDIFHALKNKKINIVTVYRTLTTFEQAGIVRRVDLQKDSAYYELAGHHHHHITCTGCGTVEGFDGCGMEKLSKKVLEHSSKFDLVTRHSLELFGLCKSCVRKK